MKKTLFLLPIAGFLASPASAVVLMDYDDGNPGNGIHDADISGGGFDDTAATGDSTSFATHTYWFTPGAVQAGEASRTNIASNGAKTDGSIRSSVITAARVFLASTAATGYTIGLGDTYETSFVWRDASGWNAANGTMSIETGYYANEGNVGFDPTVDAFSPIASFTSATSTTAATWESAVGALTGAADAAAVGKTLFVRLTGTSGFGRVDNITLQSVPVPEPALAGLLSLAGLGLTMRRRRA